MGGTLFMQTLFEKRAVDYSNNGDYLLPRVRLNEPENIELGLWAKRHQDYLRNHHKVIYYNLLTQGKLDIYLLDLENQAQKYFQSLIKSLAEQEDVDEKLKENDVMLWVQKMNNIQNRAREIVNSEIIYN